MNFSCVEFDLNKNSTIFFHLLGNEGSAKNSKTRGRRQTRKPASAVRICCQMPVRVQAFLGKQIDF